MNRKEATRLAQTFASDCIAFRVRVLNRVITSLYDSALKPFGIMVNQTTLLAMLTLAGRARSGEIGKELHMEKSTVSLNLERMRKNGWIEVAAGDGGPTLHARVTPVGRKLLASLYPEWEKAQAAAACILTVFSTKLQELNAPFPGIELWAFPMDPNSYGAPGALVKMEGVDPGGNSTLVYFHNLGMIAE